MGEKAEHAQWSPDPTGAHEWRWWDGAEWTDQVADGGVTSTDPMPDETPPASASSGGDDRVESTVAMDEPTEEQSRSWAVDAPTEERSRSWFARHGVAAAMGAVALVVGVAIGAVIAFAGMRSDLDDERSARSELEAELDDVRAELDEARDALEDREARRRADEAEAARIEAEREQEESEAAEAERLAAQEQAAAEAAAAAQRREIPRDGTYEVGRDIDPGRWRTDGGGSCYWAILSEPTGALGSIITNSFGGGPQIVDLSPGQYFETGRCGTWKID